MDGEAGPQAGGVPVDESNVCAEEKCLICAEEGDCSSQSLQNDGNIIEDIILANNIEEIVLANNSEEIILAYNSEEIGFPNNSNFPCTSAEITSQPGPSAQIILPTSTSSACQLSGAMESSLSSVSTTDCVPSLPIDLGLSPEMEQYESEDSSSHLEEEREGEELVMTFEENYQEGPASNSNNSSPHEEEEEDVAMVIEDNGEDPDSNSKNSSNHEEEKEEEDAMVLEDNEEDLASNSKNSSHLEEEEEEEDVAMVMEDNGEDQDSNSKNSSNHEEEKEEEDTMVVEDNEEDPASNSKNSSHLEEEEEEEESMVEDNCQESASNSKKKQPSPESPVPAHIKIIQIVKGHHPVKYQCTICKKQFGTKAHCRYHEFCLTGEARFKCEIAGCGRGFMTKTHYNYHINVHARGGILKYVKRGKVNQKYPQKRNTEKGSLIGNKGNVSKKRGRGRPCCPCACDQCGKVFSAKGDLQLHLKTQSGEMCVGGTDARVLVSNVKTVLHSVGHSESRPFKCYRCKSSFQRKSALLGHLRIVHDEVKMITRSGKKHLKVSSTRSRRHHRKRPINRYPHACSGCEKKFKRIRTLRDHVRKAHTEQKIQTPKIPASTKRAKPNQLSRTSVEVLKVNVTSSENPPISKPVSIQQPENTRTTRSFPVATSSSKTLDTAQIIPEKVPHGSSAIATSSSKTLNTSQIIPEKVPHGSSTTATSSSSRTLDTAQIIPETAPHGSSANVGVSEQRTSGTDCKSSMLHPRSPIKHQGKPRSSVVASSSRSLDTNQIVPPEPVPHGLKSSVNMGTSDQRTSGTECNSSILPQSGPVKHEGQVSSNNVRKRLFRSSQRKEGAVNEPPTKRRVSSVNQILKTNGRKFKETLNKLMETKAGKLDFKRKFKNGETIVHQAALVGHVVALEHFISLGFDVDARCSQHRTPLHYAVCQEENLEGTVSILVENGAEQDAVDKKGNTALFAAISYGRNMEQLEYLVNQGSDWKAKNRLGYSVLHVAANYGNTEAVKYFLAKRVDINCLSSIHGSSPLHQLAFARRNFAETLKILIENQAEIDKKDKYGNNVLLLATLAGRPLKDLKLLVNYGCDWRATNGNDHGIIHLAARSSRLSVLKYFISKGADVNSPDNNGRTPLHQLVLSKKCSPEKFQLMWESGVDIHAVDKWGVNVILMAVISGKGRDILASLISRGANWKAKMENGYGVLHLAAENGNLEAVKYFLSLKADVNATCKHGETPLHRVVYAPENFTEIVHILHQSNAAMNQVDNDGNNVLFPGVESGRSRQELDYLMELGADWKIINKFGESVLHAATRSGSMEALESFLAKGVRVQWKTHSGDTPLHYAARYAKENFTAMVDLLETSLADLNEIDREGNNVLMIAALAGKTKDELENIVKLGGDWRVKNMSGKSILEAAAEGGNVVARNYFRSLLRGDVR